MSIHRYAAKRDLNERPIIDALTKCGCLVLQLDEIDLLVFRAGKLFVIEVKGRKGRLTARQASLRQQGWPIHVVIEPIDALRVVGFVDARARAVANGEATEARIEAEVKRLTEGA